MNAFSFRIAPVLLAACALASAQTASYTNFIRQIQMPTGVQWDATVAATGSQLSSLAIDPGGANFQLWTVNSSPLTNYLLDTKYVGTYVPLATVVLRSEDPYPNIIRTRADRPFYADVTIAGLLSGASDPLASKSVTLMHYVQSYGADGTGVTLDRTRATLLSQASLTTNGSQTLTFTTNAVPGSVRTKVRGEERFSVFSIADYQAPASQLASQFIQIWPVADGSIAGISQGMLIRSSMPQLTLTLNDLYPSSTTYAQVYMGEPVLGTTGAVVPGSVLVVSDTAPQSRVLVLRNYDAVFPTDGHWTLELLTSTPFGIERLAYVSFDIRRTITLHATFTTIE